MHSKNYRIFKNAVGQSNHFMITELIGLDAVKNGAKKPDEFNVSWNPQNIKNSVIRSRKHVISSSLAWVVDNLDMYFRLCNKNPVLYQDKESKDIEKTKQSVYKKYRVILNNHPTIANCQKAFVDLLICWRNNLIHYDADNKLSESTYGYFKNHAAEDITIQKYNIDTELLISNFKSNNAPTFKEAATMISMAIHFVESLDDLLISEVNKKEYIKYYLKKRYDCDGLAFVLNSESIDKKVTSIKAFLKTNAITDDFYDENCDVYIHRLVQLSKEELNIEFE